MGGSLTVEVDQTIGGRLGVTGQVFTASSLSAVFICKTSLVSVYQLQVSVHLGMPDFYIIKWVRSYGWKLF